MLKSVELRQQRAGIIAQARQIVTKAQAETRDMTGEEQQEFDKRMADADRLKSEAEGLERTERLEAAEAETRASQGRRTDPGTGRVLDAEPDQHQYAESIRAWALQGTDHARRDADTLHMAARSGINLGSATLNLNTSTRALSRGTPAAGGHTVPVGMVQDIITAMKFFNPIRGRAGALPTTTGADLDYPRASDVTNTASIVGEGATINTNVDPAFDKVTLKAWKYATTIVLLSVELLQDSSVNVPSLLANQLGERMGRGQATHFVTGNGTTQPQGLATGAVAGANLATGNPLTIAKVIDLIYSVDRAYRMGASFVCHDDTVAGLMKLTDTTGQFMWQPSVQAGEADRLRGYPIEVSNDMTSIATPGTNQPLLLFGNLAGSYLVRDVIGSMQMVRLNELYAATGQIGFLLMSRADGRYVRHSGCVKSLNSFV